MLGQFSLTAMAVNYTRAQTQRGPLTSQKICHITKKKNNTLWNDKCILSGEFSDLQSGYKVPFSHLFVNYKRANWKLCKKIRWFFNNCLAKKLTEVRQTQAIFLETFEYFVKLSADFVSISNCELF